jgi:hypothetical protein
MSGIDLPFYLVDLFAEYNSSVSPPIDRDAPGGSEEG